MTALLLETATEICSVAVWRDGQVLAEKVAAKSFQHAAMLNVYIDEVLRAANVEPAQLEAIGLSEGPGSYTSLRVGAAMAKGLCFALPHVKLYPLSSLRALARAAYSSGIYGPVIATQNSRRNEVYASLYEHEADLRKSACRAHADRPNENAARALATDDPILLDFFARHPEIAVSGSGSEKIKEALGRPSDRFLKDHLPVAANLGAELDAVISAGDEPANVAAFEPMYLKPPFVTVPKNRSLL
ncbi:MAG: tRNA (adenosine(37)-N6)-threonylcarbamoyltransferase complex dimerization subunit type 1 TsaB [Bacteroidota bacterium]